VNQNNGAVTTPDVAAAHRLGIDEPRRANALAFERQKQSDLVALCGCQRPKLQYLGFARRQHDPFTPAGVNNRPGLYRLSMAISQIANGNRSPPGRPAVEMCPAIVDGNAGRSMWLGFTCRSWVETEGHSCGARFSGVDIDGTADS